jgi:integrase
MPRSAPSSTRWTDARRSTLTATKILVAFRHGLRAAETRDLRWDQVAFNGAVPHVRRVKNGTPNPSFAR